MISYFDLGTGRMMIVPKGYEIVTSESSGQMIFTPWSMEDIKSKQRWLYVNLEFILKEFNVVSFDNLAIEQLNVKRLLSKEEWDEFYQGNDGSSTYYIDMVERKFARSSTADFDKRYDLMDSVDDMFRKIVSEN